jgi:hypothetical protein
MVNAYNELVRLRNIINNIPCPNYGQQRYFGMIHGPAEPRACGWCGVCEAQSKIKET